MDLNLLKQLKKETTLEKQLMISVINAVLSDPAFLVSKTGKIEGYSPDKMWTMLDKDSTRMWRGGCNGNDSETRYKFLLKRMSKMGIVTQKSDKSYSADRNLLRKVRNELMSSLCETVFDIQGILSDGLLDPDCSIVTDSVVCLSRRDMEKALKGCVDDGYMLF